MKYRIRMENRGTYHLWRALHLYINGILISGTWITQIRVIEKQIKEYEEKI